MIQNATPPVNAPVDAKLATAVDDFIATLLPEWLKRASRGQIGRLRNSFNAHRQSQERLHTATLDLIPLQQFAQEHFHSLLADRLSSGVTLSDLEWLEVTPEFSRLPGVGWPTVGPRYMRRSGLLRLMQNFHPGASFFEGSGLVERGGLHVLSGSLPTLIEACRTADVGGLYQKKLEQVFNEQTRAALAEDKRAGLVLATEIAVLQGHIDAYEQVALSAIARHGVDAALPDVRGYPGKLTLLGHKVADALVIRMQGPGEAREGWILYLPSDPTQALRRFASLEALRDALLLKLRRPAYRQYLSQLIGLGERPAFLRTLGMRLQDAQPDLELQVNTIAQNAFEYLTDQQVQQLKEDARLLLVPTADADLRVARQRLHSWETAGLDIVNLAGLFIPGIGSLLLGQLVVQTLHDVFEGASDWSRGHQHEALEHMLSVAETLTVNAATIGGAVVARSAFVDSLQPVSLDAQRCRLWAEDLTPYAITPQDAVLQADGLYGNGRQRWIRVQTRYYQIHRAEQDGPWRLRHPRYDDAYGPVVLHNGERGWRLLLDSPRQWHDSARMLDSLWPQQPPIDAQRAGEILRVAGVDQDELRGVLVENRPVPVNLRDALLRFEADAKVERFFTNLRHGMLSFDEVDLLAWCKTQSGVRERGPVLRNRLVERMPVLRGQLFAHLLGSAPIEDTLLALVKRDFPGLPEAYAREVIAHASDTLRMLARVEEKLPAQLAQRAHSLLRLARLNRALAGLYLGSSYCNETGELVLSLLQAQETHVLSQGQAPSIFIERHETISLELRETALGGRSIKTIGPVQNASTKRVLVNEDGRFHLYDGRGRELEVVVDDPASIFDAITASLSAEQRHRLGISETGTGSQLRRLLLQRLPTSRDELVSLLGWPPQARWFNPGRRLPDGRVGYPLSGRRTTNRSPRETLRNGLGRFYPGLSDSQIEQELERLLHSGRAAYEALANLEYAHAQLEQALDRWQGVDQDRRRSVAQALRRAWHGQGEIIPGDHGEPIGQRLRLSGTQLSSLPELPPQVEFAHITALVINDSAIIDMPLQFLRNFPSLRELNLSNNRLCCLPTGIGFLRELSVLRLGHNRIRLGEATTRLLEDSPRLTHLDLSYNALPGFDVRFDRMSALVDLNLRHCRLSRWPARIEACPLLERVDLRDNQITSIPAEAQRMSLVLRQSFILDRNPLGRADLERFLAADSIQVHTHPPEQVSVIVTDDTRALWIGTVSEALRDSCLDLWNSLVSMPESDGLFGLLGRLEHTSDYIQARSRLASRVWGLLGAIHGNADLRQAIYRLAAEPLTCEHSVLERFSALQTRIALTNAEQNAALPERGGELLALGRGLFRLDRVQIQARELIRERTNARLPVDPLAVELFFRVQLRERLELPFQPSTMRYGETAGISDSQVEQVFLAVRRQETPQALASSLGRREFWRRYMRVRHEAAFIAVEEDFATQIRQLEGQTPALEEGQLRELIQDLHDRQASALHRLLMDLTRQLLYGIERGQG